MVTRRSSMLLTAVILYVAARASAQDDYDAAPYRDGSCSLNAYDDCVSDALCKSNPDHTRFMCYCPDGFDGDGFSDAAGGTGCRPTNGIATCTAESDCFNAFQTTNVFCEFSDDGLNGVCKCNEGFTFNLEDYTCYDVDECLNNMCSMNAKCENFPGSYSCTCEGNYVGDGTVCTWRCYTHGDCNANSKCRNDGSCKCDAGFSSADGTNRDCADIDECANGELTCPDRADCVNTAGSAHCECQDGFYLADNQCKPYDKTCNAMYSADMTSGVYTIDPDGEGPKPPVDVYCEVRDGYAITVVGPRDTSPEKMPKSGGTSNINYGNVDPQDLLDNSPFCSQEIWVECTKNLVGSVSWTDVSGNTYTSWPSQSNECPCGQMNQCDTCNCGAGAAGLDQGYIINMAVSSVTFPSSNRAPGTYMVGPLRCGPEPFDIPKDCHEAKFKNPWKIKENRAMYIDVDGPGGQEPFMVYCDMERFSHVGITQIPPEEVEIKSTLAIGESVEYLAPGDERKALIDGSIFCSQKIQYNCEGSTMTEAGVQVVSGGGSSILDMSSTGLGTGTCRCFDTDSCGDGAVCSCERDGGQGMDMDVIIDKSKLPIVSVTSTVDNNAFVVGPLECSQKQFGIQPNCEKYRHEGETESYAYLVDPDGPAGSDEPFLAECRIDDYQGKTVINNDNGDGVELDTGDSYSINYPNADDSQIGDLKERSTYCTQQVTLYCDTAAVDASRIELVAVGGSVTSLDTVLSTQNCQAGGGSMDVGMIVKNDDQDNAPIVSISNNGAGPARLDIGPLVCQEIFENCQDYQKFVNNEGVEGENRLAKGAQLTIDPDGFGAGEPFVVRCNWAETIINPPPDDPDHRPRLVLKTTNNKTDCWTINYTDDAGNGIGAGQMGALVDGGRNCRQELTIGCGNTGLGGKVTYKTCDGREMTNLVGDISGEATATCACGVTGVCQGGPQDQCNCESPSSMSAMLEDKSVIFEKEALPICEICLTIVGTETTGIGAGSGQKLSYNVGRLMCGKKGGKFPNCQMYRQESRFADNLPEMTDMWFDADGDPFLVGCQFTPDPPIGELIVRPTETFYEFPPDDQSPLNVTVVYKGIDITRLPEVTDGSNYCSQNIYLFCADSLPELTGVYGFYHRGQKIQDAEMRVLSEEEGAALCDDPLFSDKCNNCPGQRPRGLSIIDKSMVPVTDIVLPPDSGVTLAIDDATCGNIEKDCDAILKAGREEEILEDGTYVIDPDQGGPLPPFKVECDFIEGTGVTNVAVDERWTDGSVGASSDDSGFPFRFEATYPTATPEQVNSLTENSEFCWQGVKYECQGSAIYNDGNMDTVLSLNGEPSTSFGTGSNSEYLGCACGLLGTCETKDVTCNCDAKGPMTEDRGFITDPAALPVTAIDINTPPTGSGRVTVTSVRCAPTPVDLPESCEEAYEWGQASANGKVNGVDFTVSGPYLVSPGDVEPFLVYCDFTSEPGNPITVIKPEPTNDEPVDDADEEVDYRGPTDEQLQALISVSGNCYQPVRVDCYAAKFLDGGVSFIGASGASSNEWNALGQAMCTCGVDGQCGGTESYTQQKNTKCNCDLGDDVHRRDSAILTVKSALPLRQLYTGAVPAGGQLNLTVGDLVCARDPLDFDECATGFNDCADEAVCRNTADGFECSCPAGWQGRTATKSDDDPIANGRQCIDDDECAGGGPCPWNAKCVNTPGSFACECNRGFRNSGPLTCVDIDECTEEGDHEPCDPNARCINSIGSYRCFCKRGYRGDGFKCFPVQKCACFGDPHCVSFDGKWNHYQGQCTYTVAQGNCDNNDTLPTFKVTADNWDRDYGIADIAWIKDVKVEVYGDVIEIKQGRKVFVNGVKRRYYKRLNADRTSVMLRVARIGLRVELFTDFGLEVFADGQDQLEVMVPDNLQGSMCGLCGNYNGDPEDDWTIGPACPATEGQSTDREAVFGTSWTDVSEESCNVDCDAPEPEERCDHPDAAKEQCDKFFDNSESPFNECIEKMPAEMLTQMQYSCTFDMCRVPSMTDALCEFGEAMASMCEDILSGAVIEWRSEYCTGTVECEMNEEYKECGPTIEPTCDAQDMVQEEQCRFNCYCQEGYMREMGECIHKDECGCLYGDVKMEIGDSMLTDDCSNMVVCMSHNNTDEQPHSCGANEVCSMTDGGEEECVCDDDSTMNPETGLCESPVTGDCEDVELKYFYDTNVLNIDNLDGGEVIIPRTPTETFKVTYMVDDGDFASFEAVKFKLIGGDAQTVRVFAVGENPRDTLEVVSASDVNRDQEITLTFTLSPRGKRLRFVVVPKNDIPCLVILETRLCLEESPDTAPITSDAVQCSEVTGNTPQLGPKFKDNVIDIDLTDAGDIITPKFPDSKYTVVYKRLDGESATFRSITYKLNGNAKRVSVWVVNDGPEDEVTTENRLDVQADQEINVVFEEMPIGRKIRVAVIPYDGQTAPSLTIVNIEVCDEPVDEPVTDTVTTCMEEGKINPATYVHFTSNVESVDRSQAADRITPADRDSRFVATYAIEDYQEATFSGMTYRLSGGGAKRVTVWVVSDDPANEVAVYTLRNVQPDQDVRVDFAEMPEGKKVRIAVIPNDGQPAPDLEVVNIEACVVPSQPVPSSAAVCEETGMANDPGMAIDYTSNVANIDQPAGEGEVISPADVTGKMKVSYAAENYEDATFRSVKFRVLNGNAKRVTVWVVGDNPLDERDMQQSNNVSPADGDITVEFSAQPVGRKLRIVVVPNDGENVPSLQVLSVDVCDGPSEEEDPCEGVVCEQENSECVDGECKCIMGYNIDCEHCVDINECEIGEHTCVHLGQVCVNTEGSFQCECQDGYEERDGYCHDINECDEVPGRCGPHSQCKNMLGTFDCACCMGYEKNGAECQRVPGTPLYGGPGEECCACTGDSCDNTEPVCATDGQSYPNYKAMVEAGCRKNVTLRVSYKGSCEDDCGAVQCEGMKVCINSGPGGVGQCECEGCGGGGASETSGEVCASNGKTYPSECFFNLVKCETGNDDLSLASDSEPCEGGSGGPQVSQWGPWSPCSETCGAGSKTRTRTALRETSFALEQTVLCYTTCPEGLCQDDTCSNPGQVCLKGQCMCPDCQGWLSDPVCGLVGDTVKTYDNECQMQREACQLTKNFIKLEDQACENKPRDCGLIRYFARLTDDNGCVSDGVENIGLCYGGCEKMGECCRPDPDVPRSSVSLSYTCPNGEIITRQEEKITACSCINEPQH